MLQSISFCILALIAVCVTAMLQSPLFLQFLGELGE